MSQSFTQLYTHIVFSTKHRKPYLDDADIRPKMHAYLAGACKNLDSTCLIIGGATDHVHLLCRMSKKITAMKLLAEIKRESSKWVKKETPNMKVFGWQDGYGAYSISPSHIPNLTKYIASQEEHHKKETFKEEFMRLLKKYGVKYDERYMWD